MTKQEFTSFKKALQSRLEGWAIENFGSWGDFKSYIARVDSFEVPVELLPPSTYQEWMDANPGQTMSEGLITVHDNWVRGFEVCDGHNRLKDYIKNGVKSIKVKYVI